MEGLDVTVLKLSEVRADNEKFRIDDGYFAKLPVQTQRRIEAMPHARLGSLCDVFRKGIFDIKADTYAESGVPFVRIGNLRDGLIDDSDIAYITREAHAEEAATALRFSDLVLSKTAYAAASFVNLPDCNVSQDTIAVRLSGEGAAGFRSGFIAAFLNCRYGLALMARQFQGNVQAHLSLPDGRKVPVPRFHATFQDRVDGAIRNADAQLRVSASELEIATEGLTAALGLRDWQPPEPLTYTERASAAFAAGRLDAEYYQPKYDAVIDEATRRGASIVLLGSLVEPFIAGIDCREFVDEGAPYIRVADIRGGRIEKATAARIAISMAQIGKEIALHEGDVLFTRKGSFGNAAVVRCGQEDCVMSTEIIRLRIAEKWKRKLLPEFLVAYFNSWLGKWQAQRWAHGVAFYSVSQDDLGKFHVPIPTVEAQQQIRNSFNQSEAAHHRARELLEAAKRAVEIAIEDSEKAALRFLEPF